MSSLGRRSLSNSWRTKVAPSPVASLAEIRASVKVALHHGLNRLLGVKDGAPSGRDDQVNISGLCHAREFSFGFAG